MSQMRCNASGGTPTIVNCADLGSVPVAHLGVVEAADSRRGEALLRNSQDLLALDERGLPQSRASARAQPYVQRDASPLRADGGEDRVGIRHRAVAGVVLNDQRGPL